MRDTVFFKSQTPRELVQAYGSPLYVYNEEILRQNCRELKGMCKYPRFSINFSAKANANLHLMAIVREEGLDVDAMSPGEIHAELAAGFEADRIFFIPNNVGDEEFLYAIERNILTSVDSLSQLERYGRLNTGGRVAVRINPGVGAGHHEKVVTGGKKTKFGISIEDLNEIKNIADRYKLKVVGINQHIGSLFMDGSTYIDSVKQLAEVAMSFPDLEFIDFGGGFGIPYKHRGGEVRLDLVALGKRLDEFMHEISGTYAKTYGRELAFKVEPGRYVVCESGALLGTVHAIKYNGATKYVGTDIGMNVLARPVLYDAFHDMDAGMGIDAECSDKETVTVVGNICESGDILAKDRQLSHVNENDIICVYDAGAYGMSMSSNYNNRLRPAEVLLKQDGSVKLIRRRDTFEDLMRVFN